MDIEKAYSGKSKGLSCDSPWKTPSADQAMDIPFLNLANVEADFKLEVVV